MVITLFYCIFWSNK